MKRTVNFLHDKLYELEEQADRVDFDFWNDSDYESMLYILTDADCNGATEIDTIETNFSAHYARLQDKIESC